MQGTASDISLISTKRRQSKWYQVTELWQKPRMKHMLLDVQFSRILLTNVHHIPNLLLKSSWCSRLGEHGVTKTIEKTRCKLLDHDSHDRLPGSISKSDTDSLYIPKILTPTSRKDVAIELRSRLNMAHTKQTEVQHHKIGLPNDKGIMEMINRKLTG